MDPHEQMRSITAFLQKVYLWPKGDNPDNVNYLLYSKLLSIFVLIEVPVMLTVAHAYHYSSIVNSSMMTDLTVLLVTLLLLSMFALFVKGLKDNVRVMNFYAPQMAPLHGIRINYEKITRMLRYLVAIIIFLTGLLLEWDTENCEKRKTRNNSLQTCGFFIPVYLPFEFNFFPLKQYILIHQGCSLLVSFSAILQMASLMFFSIVNAVGILSNLIHLAEDFDNDLKHNLEVTERLRTMVKIHQFVKSFIQDFDKQIRYINMVHFLLGGLIIATTIFDVMKTGSFVAVVHGTSWAIGLTLVQMAGQITIDKSVAFERALYNTRWYKLKKPADRKCFLLLLHMSQRPVAFYAGPFAEVSLPTLMALFKATYSGTTMLKDAAEAL